MACAEYQDASLHNLSCKRVQYIEFWSFVGNKQNSVAEEIKVVFDHGNVWTWTVICADTQLGWSAHATATQQALSLAI